MESLLELLGLEPGLLRGFAHGYTQRGGIIRIEWQFMESTNIVTLRFRDDGVGHSISIPTDFFFSW